MSSGTVTAVAVPENTIQWVIRTHLKPHLDEFLAIWLLIMFGEIKFPGIRNALVEFAETNVTEKHPDELEKDGIVCIGIGGGKFDEHAPLMGERKKSESASSLVMKYLGIADDPALRDFSKFVTDRDSKITGSKYDLSGLVKIAYHRKATDDMKVWEWVMFALEAIYDDSLEFFGPAMQDFAKAQQTEVKTSKGKIKVVTGRSDVGQFSSFCRSVHGCGADVVIQQNSTGNVRVFTASRLQRMYVDLSDAARMIRLEEQKRAGQVLTTDWKILGSAESVPGAENWYLHPERKMLLNGSDSVEEPATLIPLDQIRQLVEISVSDSFEPGREIHCKAGKCTSTHGNPCPWYAWGLQRCRNVRYNQYNNSQGK